VKRELVRKRSGWVNHVRGLRTALAILSTLVFCPAVLSTLTRISVTSKNRKISTGQTQEYMSKSNYGYASTNDIAGQVTRSSSSNSVDIINASDLATAVAAETTTRSATPSAKTGNAPLTVSDAAEGVFCGGKNAAATLPNCDPADPTQNTVFVTMMPNTSAYTAVQVNAGGDLQAAINKASCSPNGTIIQLQAGATFNSGFGSSAYGKGPYQLPRKTCAAGQWIIIQSSAIASLPPAGTRVSPSDAANMPNIQSVGGSPSIVVNGGANHYRFVGIQFSIPPATDTVVLIDLDAYDNGFANGGNDHMIFDRCYVHGNSELTHDYRRGFWANSTFFGLVDSYVNQFHSNTTNTGADTQTVGAAVGGAHKIVNNYLSASGENILYGGVPTNITVHDAEIRHNHFYKPTSWKGTGIVTKNLFELKNATRVLLDGNVFENTWLAAQQYALVFSSSAGDSGPNADVSNVTITHNIIRHAPNGMTIDFNGPTGTGPNQMLFQNNIWQDINNSTWGDGNQGWYTLHSFLSSKTIIHDHNTIFIVGPSNSCSYAFASNGVSSTHISAWQFTNNLVNHGTSGVCDTDRGLTEGNPTINSYTLSNRIWNRNVFINGKSLARSYPAATLWAVPGSTAVGFADNTNCVGSTFSVSACQLLSSSPYHNAGTDGKDIGADITSILNATAGVVQVHD